VLEFINDRGLVEANQFETASVKAIYNLPYMNITDQELGGNARRIAELHDSKLFLLLNKDSKTIAVLKMQEDKEAFVCKKCNESFDNKGKFLAHSRTCKD
jgi:hypothetical protein